MDYLSAQNLMEATAREAGDTAMKFFEKASELEVTFKGQADLLCEADRAVEQLIFQRLTEAYPDIAFVGEEFGRRGPEEAAYSWCVDPIDGTTNFLSGLPFTISIALARGLEPLAGVIFSPLENDMYGAAKGHGAYLNGTPIKVREQADAARFVVGTGLPLDAHKFSDGAYDRLHEIREKVAAVRIIGTCALAFAYVACGRLDGYFEGPTGFLDMAAGIIILREAEGVVSDFWGGSDFASNVTTTIGASACQGFLCQFTSKAPTA